MPRPSKGPRLWLRPARPGRKAAWFILDGKRHIGTGCGPRDLEAARLRLAAYITEAYRPERRERHIDAVRIADVITIYATDRVAGHPDAKRITRRLDRILDWWGEKSLADVTGESCRAYVAHRGNDGGARRDLQDLSAAIGHHHREGLHREEVIVALPAPGNARERFLTRGELARLIWTCWRATETQRGRATGKRTMRHLSRFLLLAYYTASRPGAVLTASWHAAPGRSYLDLIGGVFYRLKDGGRATNKRQPPVRLPPRMLAHLRRWRDGGLCEHYAVEWQGKPVASIKTALGKAIVAAGLDESAGAISPHTLRHTAVTHMLQRGASLWEAAGFAGMSPAMAEKRYGHQSPDYQASAIKAISANETPSIGRNHLRTNVVDMRRDSRK